MVMVVLEVGVQAAVCEFCLFDLLLQLMLELTPIRENCEEGGVERQLGEVSARTIMQS